MIFTYPIEDSPATQAEAEAGTETALRVWSPLRIAQAIAALPAHPAAHAASHAAAGADPLTLAQSQITGLVAALAALAPLASPAFTGNPTVPTQGPTDNSTRAASTAFVVAALNALLDGAPSALNTLKELADAINDDASFAASVTTALAGKVPTSRQVNGHALSGDFSLTKSDVGLGNCDNTSDANKPVSTAQQAALDGKAATFTLATAAKAKAATDTADPLTASNLADYVTPQSFSSPGATIGFNTALGVNANAVLDDDVTLTFSNAKSGQSGLLTISHTGGSARLVTWANAVVVSGSITTDPAKANVASWFYNGSAYLVSLSPDFTPP